MTSELKGLKGYTDGYIFDENENCIGKTYNRDHAKIIADAFERDRNTRAVPDVPELVRYSLSLDWQGDIITAYGMVKDPTGDYVRYDQAAAIIAAKDAFTHELSRQLRSLEEALITQKEIIDNLMGKGK